MLRVTTSWDDGHLLDLRVVELLDKYQLKGTFYIAKEYVSPRLIDSQIRDIASRHDIGAHTLTHPILTSISLEAARSEIVGSKRWLEEVLGQHVTSFCYPRGAHNKALKQVVREAGFQMARTVEAYQIEVGNDAYAIPTSLHIYPFPRRPIQARNPLRIYQPMLRTIPHVFRLRLTPAMLLNYTALASGIMQQADATNGVFHLWGHSWEVEQYGLWDTLETVLKLAHEMNGQAIVNRELVK